MWKVLIKLPSVLVLKDVSKSSQSWQEVKEKLRTVFSYHNKPIAIHLASNCVQWMMEQCVLYIIYRMQEKNYGCNQKGPQILLTALIWLDKKRMTFQSKSPACKDISDSHGSLIISYQQHSMQYRTV